MRHWPQSAFLGSLEGKQPVQSIVRARRCRGPIVRHLGEREYNRLLPEREELTVTATFLADWWYARAHRHLLRRWAGVCTLDRCLRGGRVRVSVGGGECARSVSATGRQVQL